MSAIRHRLTADKFFEIGAQRIEKGEITEDELREAYKTLKQQGAFDEDQKKGVVLPLPGSDQSPMENYTGSGVIEPARSIVSNLGRQLASGAAGIAVGLSPDAEEGQAAETVESIQSGAFQPQTPAGRENLKAVGDVVDKAVKVFRFPMSGLGGLAELLTGQGIEQAAQTQQDIMQDGVGPTAGKRVFEETGSPEAATVAHMAPETILSLMGIRYGKPAIDATQKTVKPVGRELMHYQGKTKRDLARRIEQGDISHETAGYELSRPSRDLVPGQNVPGRESVPGQNVPGRESVPGVNATNRPLLERLDAGGPRVKKSPVQQEALKQQVAPDIVASIREATPATKKAMQKMTKIREEIWHNRVKSFDDMPGQVVGDVVHQRWKLVEEANRRAGQLIDQLGKKLKGNNVDITPVANTLVERFDKLGIKVINKDGVPTLSFEGSAIENLPGLEGSITNVFTRMKRGKASINDVNSPPLLDAYEVHMLKQYIDNIVDYGNNKSGLSATVENALKDIRHSAKELLNNNFEPYRKANTAYSETIDALNDFQRLAGEHTDLDGIQATKQIGILMRRVMSNAQSRGQVADAALELERLARKYAAGDMKLLPGKSLGKTDTKLLIMYADELDRMFGPVQRNSLYGELDKAVNRGVNAAASSQGAIREGIGIAKDIYDQTRGVNDPGKFAALHNILK